MFWLLSRLNEIQLFATCCDVHSVRFYHPLRFVQYIAAETVKTFIVVSRAECCSQKCNHTEPALLTVPIFLFSRINGTRIGRTLGVHVVS